MKKSLQILFFSFLLTHICFAQSYWSYQTPLLSTGAIKGVHFIDAQVGWVVNEYGEIYKTTDGGIHWNVQYDAPYQLTDVYFVNAQTGWATGISFSSIDPEAPIFKTTDGGVTWVSQSTPVAHRLWSMHFVSNQIGWAVGIQYDGKNIIIKTTDGGATWNVQKTEESSNESYNSVDFVDEQIGWLVGDATTDIILKTTDGGTNWSPQTTTTDRGLNSVQFTDTQTGWTVGGSGTILKTTDGGTTWTEQTSGTTNSLESVYFISAQIGWAVGSSNYGDLGLILKTSDGGTTWTKQNSGTVRGSFSLNSVQFIDDNIGWAVGSGGLLLKTINGGSTWTNLAFITSDNLYAAYFLDANSGWAGGHWGTLLKTTNAGVNWAIIGTPNARRINDIYFADSKTGWACQAVGKILSTLDGGLSWSEISTTTTRAFLAMYFVDAKTGWAVGGGSVYRVIFKTTNGGITWTEQDVPSGNALMDVFFIDATTGWAVGMDGTILNTTNGGNDWVSQNSGRTDWLECVYFKDVNVGFVGGSEGILQTTNSGATWIFKDAGSGWIDDITFVDSLNGFAVGAVGSILSKGIDGSGNIDISGGGTKTWKTTDGGIIWTEELSSVGGWLLRGYFTDRNSGWGVTTKGRIAKYTDSLPLSAPPTNLSASAISKTEIKLMWSDNATNEDGFHLYRSDSVSGAYHLIITLQTDTTSYTDTGLIDGTKYWYRINAFNAIGNSAVSLDAFATAGVIVSVKEEQAVPIRFVLEQNYPNPFNPLTNIQYVVSNRQFVTLKVYDVLGKEIATLVNGEKTPGIYLVEFKGANLVSGIYLYRLQAGDYVEMKKMVLLR